MASETELKLALAPRDIPALLAHPLLAAQAPNRQRLRNRYFDTPALALLERRMAVRERQTGRQTLLTAKTAGTVIGDRWSGAPGRVGGANQAGAIRFRRADPG